MGRVAGLRGQVGEEAEVDLFDEVVAALVEAVDGVFDWAMSASEASGSRALSSSCQRSKLARCWAVMRAASGSSSGGCVAGVGSCQVSVRWWCEAEDGGGFEHMVSQHTNCISSGDDVVALRARKQAD